MNGRKIKKISVALRLTFTLAMILSFATMAMAADFPLGASNRTVQVTTGINPGTYLVNGAYHDDPYTSDRLIAPDFSWNPATMENYVFDPANFPDLQWHADGFPLRATCRTPVDHLGEMKYLAITYPNITNLILIGYTNGISNVGTNPNDFTAHPEFRIPLYALEISSAPGVMDGRPATLHQAGNHGGELDGNEACANLAWYLCTQYGKDAQVTNLINTTRIYIIPYTNADGNMISFRSRTGGRRTNAHGVDPNRNWAYRWGSNNGSSGTPGTGSTYRGVSPNSEPETAGISSVYRMDNIISSVSDHTSGQLIIFAWAYVRNPTDAHPLLSVLAKKQADLNGHTPQNGNVMYAQSGEINDYLWGSMRALGYTFEHLNTQSNSYLGSSTGNNYISATYLDTAGRPKEIKTNYASGSAPAANITGNLAVITNEFIALGYQDIPAGGVGNGINNSPYLPGPYLRRMDTAQVQAELDKNPAFVNGKIFMSHIASSTTNATAVARLLKANGCLGWIVVNTTTDGGYSEITPGTAYAPADILPFPVGSLTKGYAANVLDAYYKDPTITATFHADKKDFSSENYDWYRQKDAYMLNMSFAKEFANHVKGTITDGNGNLIPKATLNGSLVIEGKILNTDGTEAPPEKQWKEAHKPRYDAVGGVYDWSMLPSKQTEYPDKGWDIIASANGRYSETKNVKFPVDTAIAIQRGQDPEIFADPLYKQTVEGVNFVLPTFIATHFDFDKVWSCMGDIIIPFSTFVPDQSGAMVKWDIAGLNATINGQPVAITSLGNGDFMIAFNPNTNFGIVSNTVLNLVIDFADGSPHSAYTNTIPIGGAELLIAVTSVEIKNGQANVDFGIASANGKGYHLYIYRLGDEGGFELYNNVNYNSKGAHIKGLTNGATYFAYLEYDDGTRSDIVEFTPNVK